MSKLAIGFGFHTNTPCHCNGIGEYLGKLAADGQIITAKSVDGTASLMDYQTLRKRGAEGIGIFRCLAWKNTTPPPGWERDQDVPPYGKDVKAIAQIYLQKLQAAWPPELDKEYFYVEMINEPNKHESDWLGYFMVELGTLLMENGYKYCGPGWSGGEPEPEHNRMPGMLEWFKLIEQHPDKLAHAVHEYTFHRDRKMEDYRPYLIGRVKDVNAACIENGIKPPPIFITEFGWGADDAPSWHIGKPQLMEQFEWYLANTPNVKALHLWALDKDIKWGKLANKINPYMTPMRKGIIQTDWPPPAEPEIPIPPPIDPPPPETKPKIVIMKLAQEHSKSVWPKVAELAYDDYKRSQTASHDDMLTMMRAGNEHSKAILVDPEYPSQKEAAFLLEANLFKYEVMYVEHAPPRPVSDLFKYRPCDTERVTQVFGANPQNYEKFGLPGHDGIDYGVAAGLPYYAVQDGKVVWASHKRPSGGDSAWGYHVIVRHKVDDQVFHTVYAHARPDLPVKVNDEIAAGTIVGYSGNTGNSFGHHLHLNLLWPTNPGNGFPKWTYGYAVDPWPYLEGKDRPPRDTVGTIDLLPYAMGNGVLYEVANASGGQERFQSQIKGDNEGWQTKNALAEQFFWTNNHIYRGWDTSPGNDRWYQQQAPRGADRAQWIPRNWKVGQTFSVSLYVQFYFWNCSQSSANSGYVTDTRKFVAHHKTWTSRKGIKLNNVAEIEWVNGGETYFYAKDFGLVAWERTHQDPHTPSWSAISEIHGPGQRPDNRVYLPGCIQ